MLRAGARRSFAGGYARLGEGACKAQALGAVGETEIAEVVRVAFRPSALAASPVRVLARVLACVRVLARACANPPAKLGEALAKLFELLRKAWLSLPQECLQNASERPTSHFLDFG